MARGKSEEFITSNLRLGPVAGIPEIVLYQAHQGSGLGRLTEAGGAAPYWAYAWAGGQALARYALAHPDCVESRRVLDLGTGSGLVGIAAALAGASSVAATDVSAMAIVAARLNAAANTVNLTLANADLLDGLVPSGIDIVLAGDVFYEKALGERALRFLKRCRDAGVDVLIGDPGRVGLDSAALELIEAYAVADFGGSSSQSGSSAVYSLR